MRQSIAFVLTAGVLLAAEPSAFRAGNVNSAEPYGLTDSEKSIRANKQTIERLEKRIFALEQQIDKLTELVEGMSAVNKANSEAFAALKRDSSKYEEQSQLIVDSEAKNKKQLDALVTRQDALEKQVNKSLSDQAKNQEKLAKALENTVTKTQLEKAIRALGGVSGEFEGQQPETLLSEARKLIDSREYDAAYNRLSYLLGKQYKPAETSFYLGTVYYFQENNEKALEAFKASANADGKAKYMPVLLYYSGICHERLKNNADARKFYETLIKLYPEHNTIEGAKKRLDKLAKA
ncbi:MAG: tetratricopeptide repeat protein [Helicobacteraceae bacterium]|jgi:TolA-binding protein|nr:tetratricopeptide repeat protein [Helicobacteraceae bacterium]